MVLLTLGQFELSLSYMKLDEAIIKKIKTVKKGCALTGAGISAPSGIPTFRGEGGYWKDRDPRELASQSGFRNDPQLVWDWYNERRQLIIKGGPNPAHYALSSFKDYFEKFAVITQNVDNLHQQAGSDNVIELHGNIFRNKCNKCGKSFGKIESEKIQKCNECNGLIRPDVVWFGEPLPLEALKKSQKVAQESDIYFVIGTSAMVQPSASLPLIARENGAFVLEINMEKTVISPYVDTTILGDVTEILPEIRNIIS